MAKDVITRFKADVGNYDANIAKARRQLEGFKQDNLTAGGVLKQLSGNLVSTAAKFASIGAAASAAMKVAKDAFFKNEEQLDEWGRTVKSAEGLYSGFLSAINTGDIRGYLNNMNSIVKAAREAYDAMDALGTFNAFNQINQAQAQTNLTNAIADFREGNGSKDAVRSAADALITELQQRQQYEQQAYESTVASIAKQRGVSAEDLMAALSGSYGNYQALKNTPLTGSRTITQSQGITGGTTSFQIAAPANEEERLGQALRQLNDTELKDLQALGAAAQRTANEIANTNKMVARVLRGNTVMGGAGGNGNLTDAGTYTPAVGSIDAMVAKVKELQDEFNKAANQSIRDQLLPQLEAAQFYLESMKAGGPGKVELPSGDLTSRFLPDLSTAIEPIATDNSESLGAIFGKIMAEIEAEDVKPATDRSVFEKYNQAVGGFSQIASGFKQLGVDLPDEIESLLGVLQGLSSIIGGASTIIEALGFGAMSANTVALSANTAALIGLTSAVGANTFIDAILPFAGGGVVKAAGGFEVPGNFNSLDQVPALLNSGEVVLNQAQAGVLAANLQNSGLANLHLETIFTGEMIRVLLNNNSRRTGRGSYVTTKAG